MEQETGEARVRRVLATFMSGDQEKIASVCHPDITIEQAPGLPYGGVYKGLTGVRDMAKLLYKTWSEFDVTTERVLGDASGDHFIMMQRLRARSRKTGQATEITIAELFSFQDGRLILIRPYYWDTKALAELCQSS
jgi:ketosteroid isomerase-like protein